MPLEFRLHEQTMNFENQTSNPDLKGRLLYLIVPYVFLLIVSFCFHKKSLTSQLSFPIYPLPSEGAQNFIYFIVVLFLGAIGIYAAVGDTWSAYNWILYAVCNILLALYVFFYSLTSRFTLFLTTIAAFLLAVDVEWLFIKSADMTQGTNALIIRNLIGAVGAWALIYFLLTFGQFLVHTIGIGKKFQAIVFFIVGILLLIGIAYWNKSTYCGWNELIGFIAVGAFLLLFGLLNTHHNSSNDIEGLVK